MPSVRIVVEGDVHLYSVGDDAELAEYVAEILESGPFGENGDVEVLAD